MKLVFFGLTISSSWGNGHATLLRALVRPLIARGHRIVFFERDVSYYAAHRDLHELPGGKLILYSSWEDVAHQARVELSDADGAIVTSYCPDGIAASELVWDSAAIGVFYDMDTPVTLSRWRAGEPLTYVDERGLADYDLVLSFTGGGALTALQEELGAGKVAPLYGSVDPDLHRRVATSEPRHEGRLLVFALPLLGRRSRRTRIVRLRRRRQNRRSKLKIIVSFDSEALRVIAISSGSQPNSLASSRLTLSIRGSSTPHMCSTGTSFEKRRSRIIASSTCDGVGLTPPLLRLMSVLSASNARWISPQ
jgi:spore maturation protein CgeB